MNERIPDPVQVDARAWPDAPAIITPNEVVSYAELDRRVAATVAWLGAHGIEREDRLAMYHPSDVEYLVLVLAAFRAGVVVCPLSMRQPPAAVPEMLERIACRTLVAAPDPAYGAVRRLDLPTGRADAPHESVEPMWSLGAPATLLFTSGSTGTPKVALHMLGNHVASARGLAEIIPLRPGDRWLLDLPLYHVGGLAVLIRCVLAGAAIVCPERGRYSEEVIAKHEVTHASFVATQLLRIMERDPSALGKMKTILLGGSAIPTGLLGEAYMQGLPVHTSYGMTEMASTVTTTPPKASRDMLATSGAALPDREVRLAEDGEVLVRGATLFAGYVEGESVVRPDAGGGWFPTGDLGAWCEVGGRKMLRVVGRKDNLFTSGGENVQPEEVEAALSRLAGVERAVVVPTEDAEFGHRPVAFVKATDWTPEEWRDALDTRLPRFKVPIAFYPWPKQDVTMKVDRQGLARDAAMYRTEG